MKKLYCFVLGFISSFLCWGLVYRNHCKNTKKSETCEYIVEDIDTSNIDGDVDFRSSIKDIKYADGVDPYGVYNKKEGLVKNADIAYKIGYNILCGIYGTEHINAERPFHVKLLRNKYWLLKGSLPQGYLGGVAFIIIKKDDGQVQAVWHEK